MRFQLIGKDGKQFHEGVAPVMVVPDVITWGNRAFAADRGKGDTVTYREVSAYRIAAR